MRRVTARTEFLILLLNEYGLKVAGAVQNTDNVDSVLKRPVKNHISTHREAAKSCAENFAHPAHARLLRKKVQFLLDGIDENICAALAVVSDIIPDFPKVRLSARA